MKWGVTLIGAAGMDNQLMAAAGFLLGLDTAAARELSGYIDIVVCGAHLQGFPLNSQLTERGGTLVRRGRTAKAYRMLLIGDAPSAKPGLVSAPDAPGARDFPVEIWRLPDEKLAGFVRLISEPLALGRVQLESGESLWGFTCTGGDYPDISEYGGWANYSRRV